jgi:S-formylglutathione hydrolase FrmB
MEFHANSIMQHANFSFVIGNDVYMPEVKDLKHYDREKRNLFLLHGLTGTDTDWLYGGLAQEMAIQYNLNVFMPTTGNSFYVDKGYPGENWGEYIGRELPEYIEKTFNVELTRENTIIGGLSMGGYGALHTALDYPERFGKCIAISSALIIHEYAAISDHDRDVVPRQLMEAIFGDPSKVEESELNPEVQFIKLKAAGEKTPQIYLACGTEDDLIGHNRDFAAFMKKNGADLIFEEGAGKHDWTFWNEYLDRGLKQLM